MMKKVKIKQLSELELYAFLRQQACEGWFPTSFSSSYIILEESQPQDVIFHFDTFPYTYSAIEKLNKKFPSYLDAFETEGWHYVAHYQSHYLFYSSDVFAYIPKIEQMKFKQFKTYLVHDLFSATLSLLAISFILAFFLMDLNFLINWDTFALLLMMILISIALFLQILINIKYLCTFNELQSSPFNDSFKKYRHQLPTITTIFSILNVVIVLPLCCIGILLNKQPSQETLLFLGLPFGIQFISEVLEKYSPLQLSTKKFNALSWILPLLLLLWSAFFDMSHPYNEVDVKDIITIADLTPHEVLTYYSQYSNHIGPIFEEVKIYSESSSLHQLDFKSFKTSSSQLQTYLNYYFTQQIKQHDPFRIYPYLFAQFKSFNLYVCDNQDLFIVAEKDDEFIYLYFENNREDFNYVIQQVVDLIK